MNDRNYGGQRRSFGPSEPREMHKAVCADCGKECEVPFKPTEGRPVYCRDCLPKYRKPRF
ncbi:MAG: DNA-directed RNA polymerase [Methanomicrobium sp.]|nr:DNA-directed RNA polymerase [Methanomicrobium sp.]